MMLDLNIASSEIEKGPAAMDDSGTSNSSVLNAEISSTAGDEDSCSPMGLGFQFGILKNREDWDDAAVTKELFPTAEAAESSSSSRAAAAHWADLGLRHAANEVRALAQHVTQPHPQPQPPQPPQQVKKSWPGPRSRSSQYRGVTFYRRTGRWESHIWDCGKQVYLGGFDTAHAAARAYDRAAIKFRGVDADINFTLSDYDEDLKQMRNLSKEEFVHILRRQSTGFSRGSSKYQGVTLHKCGRWEARMGQFLGKNPNTTGKGEAAVSDLLPTPLARSLPSLDFSLYSSPRSSWRDRHGSFLIARYRHGSFDRPSSRSSSLLDSSRPCRTGSQVVVEEMARAKAWMAFSIMKVPCENTQRSI